MPEIPLVTFRFFGRVPRGQVVGRARRLPAQSIPGLNGLVLSYGLPSRPYRFAANTPIVRLLDPAVGLACLAVGLQRVTLTIASKVPIAAERFGAAAARIARAVPLSTAGTLFSVPVAVSLLRREPLSPSPCAAVRPPPARPARATA